MTFKNPVYDTYYQILVMNLYEDRSEYSDEDLAHTYGQDLTPEQVQDLKKLLHSDEDPMYELTKILEEEYAPTLGTDIGPLFAAGAARDTIDEAFHQGLDGWSTAEQATIYRFLFDIAHATKITANEQNWGPPDADAATEEQTAPTS